ncbi:unnamed protein product [Symbiodinium sp. CCMP2456]|nr:unnamed protein product [Symbiodinium sp. CCMP2456]
MKDVDSYVICDSKAKGFPIRHVSKGFQELFGYDASECVGMRCGEMIGGAGLLNHKPGMAMLNKVASDLGLSEEQANAGIKRMTQAAEEAVQTVNQGGSSPSVLLINTRKNGELFVCEMSLCKNQHPTMGWHYHAGIQRDVSDRISVERLLQAASEGVSYDQICQEWRTATVPKLGETLAEKLGASRHDLHSVAEQMWKDELAKVFQKKDGSKTAAPDTDMRSVWSRSTASTMHSHRSSRSSKSETKGESEKKIHHLGALFGHVIPDCSAEEKPEQPEHENSEESGRFLDLLEGELSDDEEVAKPAPMQPLPLSVESLRQRDAGKPESLKSWQSEDFKSVSGESDQEEAECGTSSTEDNSPTSDASLICDEVQDPARHVGRSVLRNLDIPMVLAAPTVSGFPVVLRSRGFEDLAGPSLQIKVGSRAEHSLQPSDERAQSVWAEYCEAVMAGHFYAHPTTGGGIAILEGLSDFALPSGELAFVKPFHGRFGNVIDCLVYLKQVELDDCPYLIALHSYLPQISHLERDRPRLLESEFYKVGVRLDEVIAELASEFFYYAPMRRQTTLYPRREQSCQDHALLDLLVHEL